jgi:Rrf2 family protein
MLSQTSRYALSLLCYLARHGEGWVPAHQIAVDTGTPANYVAKILGALRKGGVVEGEKGWGGGYALRPRAGEISVGEVMALFEEKAGPVACPFVQPECGCYLALHSEERVPVRRHGAETSTPAGGGAGILVGEAPGREVVVLLDGRPGSVACPFGAPECVVTVPCPLHQHWARVRQGFWGLAETRIADLVGRPAG